MGILAKSQSLGIAALLLAVSTILSRCMGLIREKIISWQFGAGSEADVYFASFVVPDIINYLLAGGFMGIVLIPLLSKAFAKDEADGWKFFSAVLTWMALAAFFLTSLALFFAADLSRLAAPGLSGALNLRLQFFMHLTLPTQFFFLTGSCVMSILFLRRQFVIPALAPLIYNGCIILFGVTLPMLGLVQGMTGYCVGVLVGAATGTLLLPLIVVRSGGLHYRPVLYHPLFKKFLLLALPLMLGQTITALDEQFLRIFGSLTGEGSVALLSYAKRLAQVPVALIGQVAALASYPFLVSLLTKGDTEGFTKVLTKALRTGTGLIIPLALWMAVLAPSAFSLLFFGGRMGGGEVLRAVPLLQLLLVAAPFWVILEILTRGFYAMMDTVTPALSGTIVTLAFLPVYYFLAVPHGPAAIALCSFAGLLVFTIVLSIIWMRRQGAAIFRGLVSISFTSFFCALPGVALGYCADAWIRELLQNVSPILSSLAGLSCAGLIFLVTFVPLAVHFCPDLFERIQERLRRRFQKKTKKAEPDTPPQKTESKQA